MCLRALGLSARSVRLLCQVRLHALALCELLLPRSRAFRGCLASHFPTFLERTVGFRAARPLPGPPDVAAQLRERALEAVERWAEDHGAHYQQVCRHWVDMICGCDPVCWLATPCGRVSASMVLAGAHAYLQPFSRNARARPSMCATN